MWTILVLAIASVALVAFVWRQQLRHRPTSPGRSADPETHLQQHGKYWGS
jgi:hypothetical protein